MNIGFCILAHSILLNKTVLSVYPGQIRDSKWLFYVTLFQHFFSL